MGFFEKAKKKIATIGKIIIDDPSTFVEAASFGLMVGGQMGFNVSVFRELKRLRKADQLLADLHMEFVNFFNKDFLPKAQYNTQFTFEMLEVIGKELDTVKPGAYDTISKAADEFDKLHHGPCYPNG